MAPARKTTTAGATPGLVAHHADRGGALPQLWHPSRCHRASGPGKSPSGLQGPALRGLSEALRAGRGLLFALPRAASRQALSSGWAAFWECRFRFHQRERYPGFPGSSPSLDQRFLTVAFPSSLISFPLILFPSFAFLISMSFSFSVELRLD